MWKVQDKQGDSAKQATSIDRNRALALEKSVTEVLFPVSTVIPVCNRLYRELHEKKHNNVEKKPVAHVAALA